MSLRIKGDGAQVLAQWQRMLESAPVTLSNMSRPMAEAALDKVAEGFRSQANPYGEKWQSKKVDDGRSILVGKTTRLRNWHVVEANGKGFIVAPSVKYAAAHQSPRNRPRWGKRPGSLRRLPRRMMIPIKSRGLPPGWAEELRATAAAEMRSHFRGKGASFSGAKGIGLVSAKVGGIKRRLSVRSLAMRIYRELQGG